MRGNARAVSNLGLGVFILFCALLGISGRSSRSGRDPPIIMRLISGLALLLFPLFQAVTIQFQAVQTLNYLRENNMLFQQQVTTTRYRKRSRV